MTNQIEIFGAMTPIEFTVTGSIEALLDKIEQESSKLTPDTTTNKGRKEIASLAHKIAQSKVAIDNRGKEIVSDWKERSKMVDSARKMARDRLDALKDSVRAPLSAWEAAEAAYDAQKKIDEEISSVWESALTMNSLFRERKAAEATAAAESLARENAERLSREENIRYQAAEKARLDAEAKAMRQVADAQRLVTLAQEQAATAERNKTLSEEKSRLEKLAAVKAAEDRLRKEATEAEAKRQAVVEAEKKAADAKAADIDHRRNVNRIALADLVSIGLTPEQAKTVVCSIINGKITGVSVNY